MRAGTIIGPLTLIAVGVLFLLNNAGWGLSISELFRNGWPFMLILVGLGQLAGGIFGAATGSGGGNVMSGVILITLGLLFALQQLAGIGFGRTWPILLIVIGALGLLRAMFGPALFAGRLMRGRMGR
jgi:Domain of unknown function (DUF5668)